MNDWLERAGRWQWGIIPQSPSKRAAPICSARHTPTPSGVSTIINHAATGEYRHSASSA